MADQSIGFGAAVKSAVTAKERLRARATLPGMNDTAAPAVVLAGQRPTLRRECAQVWARWELLVNLVTRDLTVRYKRSLLGFLWSFLHPLIFMVVLTLVFGTL